MSRLKTPERRSDPRFVRLVACENCRAQYDVTDYIDPDFRCHCGAEIRNRIHDPVDAEVVRCGACGAGLSRDVRHCGYCGSGVARDPHELSLICPMCGARNEEASRYCTACGVEFLPDPVPGAAETEIGCPCCPGDLSPRSVGGVRVHECPKCNGLWVPGDALDSLVRRAAEARAERGDFQYGAPEVRRAGGNPASQQIRYRRCPDCGTQMRRVNFRRSSGVVVDRCYRHGTWLDADELEQIIGFVLSGARGRQAPVYGVGAARELASSRTSASAVETFFENQEARRSAGKPGGMLKSIADFLEDLLDP